MFVEKLCVVTGFYWQEPDKLAPAEVRSNLSNPVTVLCDRVTKRRTQKVERNRFLHLRHLMYRGKLHKFLNNFKSDGRLPTSTTKAHYFKDCQGNVVRWPATHWSHLTQSSIGGSFQPLRRVGGVLMRMASVPRVEIIWRTDGVVKGTGVGPLPVHGLRHIQTVPQGVHVAQWAKRPPLKLEVPGSNPRGWFNGRAGNRDPFRWLETARGL